MACKDSACNRQDDIQCKILPRQKSSRKQNIKKKSMTKTGSSKPRTKCFGASTVLWNLITMSVPRKLVKCVIISTFQTHWILGCSVATRRRYATLYLARFTPVQTAFLSLIQCMSSETSFCTFFLLQHLNSPRRGLRARFPKHQVTFARRKHSYPETTDQTRTFWLP